MLIRQHFFITAVVLFLLSGGAVLSQPVISSLTEESNEQLDSNHTMSYTDALIY